VDTNSDTKEVNDMQWVLDNKEWLFSGIGIVFITVIISFLNKRHNPKQVQKSGDNSTNYQAGGNIQIGDSHDK